jgi:hypothetical protein
MRFYSFVAAAALLPASLAAHAASMTQQLSITNGSATYINSIPSIDTSSFQDFNASLGTLTSIVFTFQGSATASSGDNFDDYQDFIRNDNHGLQGGENNMSDVVYRPTVFNFSSSLTDYNSLDFAHYTGTGTNALRLQFADSTKKVNLTGSVTYNYTAAAVPVGATPEPSSLALLGTGILGVAGVARKRFA